MPRALVAHRMPRKGEYARGLLRAEELRRMIPAQHFLQMLVIAAYEGRMPLIDRISGKPTGLFTEVPAQRRLELVQYLVDKAVPNKIPVETVLALDEPESQAPELSDDAMRELTNEHLNEIVGSTLQIEARSPDED